jgi:hypothetical protein
MLGFVFAFFVECVDLQAFITITDSAFNGFRFRDWGSSVDAPICQLYWRTLHPLLAASRFVTRSMLRATLKLASQRQPPQSALPSRPHTPSTRRKPKACGTGSCRPLPAFFSIPCSMSGRSSIAEHPAPVRRDPANAPSPTRGQMPSACAKHRHRCHEGEGGCRAARPEHSGLVSVRAKVTRCGGPRRQSDAPARPRPRRTGWARSATPHRMSAHGAP